MDPVPAGTHDPHRFTGEGRALEQYPKAGETLYKNHPVMVTTDKPYAVEEGEAVTVPDLTGLGMAEAYTRLQLLGLRMKVHGSGVVKTQSVAPETVVAQGTEVEVRLE